MTETMTDSKTTSTAIARNYEAMFLLNQAEAAQLGRALEHIDEILRRAGADTLAMQKWDERRLAFEIEKQKRGAYILAFIRTTGEGITKIERDVQISDHVMRVLVTKADHLTEEEIASFEDRKGLDVEAKLRAERGAAEEEERKTNVRLGAPEPEAAPADETANEETAEAEAPSTDADDAAGDADASDEN